MHDITIAGKQLTKVEGINTDYLVDKEVFFVAMITGDGPANIGDLYECVAVDGRIKRAIFEACSKIIYKEIKLFVNCDKYDDSLLLQRIKGLSTRSLNSRYFRRFSTNFPILAYSFSPTSIVLMVTLERCLEIYRNLCILIVDDLKTQWPESSVVIKLCECLLRSFPDEAKLFSNCKRLCIEKIENALHDEGCARLDVEDNIMTLYWQKIVNRKFSKIKQETLSFYRKEFDKKQVARKKQNSLQCELEDYFVPEINDW
ncbi:MAG: hypothetical protein R3B45_14110 [Bdellovibrionota bacterium]